VSPTQLRAGSNGLWAMNQYDVREARQDPGPAQTPGQAVGWTRGDLWMAAKQIFGFSSRFPSSQIFSSFPPNQSFSFVVTQSIRVVTPGWRSSFVGRHNDCGDVLRAILSLPAAAHLLNFHFVRLQDKFSVGRSVSRPRSRKSVRRLDFEARCSRQSR
jgi:hypothetical protein